jgi:hypothetical protein
MTKDCTLEMDSYRLAKYAVQVPCYICEQGNTFDAELCRHCFAPMALAHQANTQKLFPTMLATIGSSGVGKTVYLGILMDMLSRQKERLQMLARGAFSINLQQLTTTALSRGEFPDKTPNEPDRWNWVHCQVQSARRKRPIEMIMPDMAGEAILEEVDHPHSYQVIRSLLLKSGGLLVLIDASHLHTGGLDQDYFTMKLLSYLSELDNNPKRGWANRPVALVLTKADDCEACFDDPAGFAKRHAPGLWRHCQERFFKHRFFAAGVAGACAQRSIGGDDRLRVPLRIEPRGIVEPFAWLVDCVGK